MAGYRHRELLQLQRQLVLSPEGFRQKHADRLEKLLADLQDQKEYSYEFLYYRITGFRPDAALSQTYTGAAVRPDLLRMLRQLSDSSPIEAAAVGENVYTIEEVCARLKVSAKTLARWREKHLVSRKYVFPDGAKRTGIRHGALEEFLRRHERLVARSAQFSLLSPEEISHIAALARDYAAEEGMTISRCAGLIAEQTGRARETLRSWLLRHDAENPDEALFPSRRSTPGRRLRRQMYKDHASGVSVEELCARLGRSRASVYRLINRARAEEVLDEPVSYISDEAFEKPVAKVESLDPNAEAAGQTRRPSPGRPTPEGKTPLPSKAEELRYFKRYNYAKYLLSQLRERLDPARYVPAKLLDEIESERNRAAHLEEQIEQAYMPLILDAARRHAGPLAPWRMLAEEGKQTLSEAIDSFDYRKGGRFAGYATWALMRTFARTVPESSPPEG